MDLIIYKLELFDVRDGKQQKILEGPNLKLLESLADRYCKEHDFWDYRDFTE